MLKISPLLVFVLFGCAAAAGAENIAAPSLKPQDTWTYRSTVERRPDIWRQTHTESTVVRSGTDTALVTNKEAGSTSPPRELLLGSDWSRFRSIGGHETVVNRPFAFPLAPGKAWDLAYSDEHPENNAHKSEKHQAHYRVVGWEDVEVPAGKFKALKVEADGTWTAEVAPKVAAALATQADAQGTTATARTVRVTEETVSGRMYKAFWYAPQVKRSVKTVEEYFDTNGVRNERFTDELESYKVSD